MAGLASPAIQGLWVGSTLSTMEELSIASFLHHGHAYILYVYEDVANIPAGTIVRDANAVLPESALFKYKEFASYAGFSNYFRYKLLLEMGGWWADSDMVCLRPFQFPSAYVFSSEPGPQDEPELKDVVNSGVIKVPPRSEVMRYAWRACQEKDTSQLKWGEIGPRLLREAIEAFGLQPYVQSHSAFCAIRWQDWETVVDPAARWEPDRDTYAVHLWNEMWRRAGYDKDGNYDPGCLYERLKTRYLRARPT